jgi:mono/diheme cytochrome c family protein/uncharacterized membrane protein YkoI
MMGSRYRWLLTVAWVVVGFGFAPRVSYAQGPAVEHHVDYAREVQPLLARRCYACHGPDKDEGGLRLTDRAVVTGELESGEIGVVPGEPEKSELVARITAEDEFTRMPPEGKPLTAHEIDLLKRWIAQGAKFEKHWAFVPPQMPVVPKVKNNAWVRNPIDAFVLSRLEARGLAPAPPAEKRSLLRRLYYDLTGLPPTPAEVAAFVADEAPDAYERVVDRLLDSPRYGERWARHWLDVVRFAETNSFERDGNKPHAWRFRDYVIRSFNDDKPYDQFIREQLAGDELPNPSPDALIATGYYRLGLWDDEPADRAQAMFDGYDDLVTTTSQGFLGLTVNCARCHDHKIDPIPQQDYYGLVAFFRGITPMGNGGPDIERPLFANAEERAAYEAALEQNRRDLDATQQQISAIENEFKQKLSALAQTGAHASDLDDLEYRFYRDAFDKLPDFDNLKAETVARVPSQLLDISLATRESNFGFVFTGVLKVPQDGEYTFVLDSDDGSRLSLEGKTVLEYDGVHGLGNPHTATVALKAGRVPVRFDYFQGTGGQGLSLKWSGPGVPERSLSSVDVTGASAVKQRDFNQLLNEQGPKLLGADKVRELRELQKTLARLKADKPPVAMALCVTERGTEPPPTNLLMRGSPHAPGDEVPPKFLEILGGGVAKIEVPADRESSGRRLALANWIASPQNGLTARVMVNRVWQHHFGRGIVRSPNNFGLLGERPTHPELLDYLAFKFVDFGWRLKPLHKFIVMSSTYRQASEGSPEALAADPGNDLFWRYDLRRLSAEEVRDSVLAVNSRLNLEMYGPGFYPTISKEVLAGQSRPGAGWGNSTPQEQARRSIYIHVKRSLLTPLLSVFDFPDTDISCEARFITTQAAQALALLNGDFMNLQAAAFAQRIGREAPDDLRKQVALAMELALCRPATESEIERGLKLIDTLQTEHQQTAEAALTGFCLYVFNLNEFAYLD